MAVADPPAQEAGQEIVSDLLEVAVALPLYETFTYRDPRGGGRIREGSQVVVPFGGRRTTGFVVGPGAPLAGKIRCIDEVLEGEPALTPEILALCRWAAAYYVAPLGELLRGAVPQGERASAGRRVRLTEVGQRFLQQEAQGHSSLDSLALDEVDRALLGRLAKTRDLRTKGLDKAGTGDRLAELVARGLVEIGDAVQAPSSPRQELWVTLVAGHAPPTLAPRARSQIALWQRLQGTATGVPWTALSSSDRLRARAWEALGLVRVEARTPVSGAGGDEIPPTLNVHQAAALAELAAALGAGYGTYVLQGITGSGKTEVYLRLIAQARTRQLGALVLVPEIALTPQLSARFRARFGDDVAVLHSGLPPAERRRAWRRLRQGEVGIALGARSAVFAPVKALGVVIVDEEHDSSFKQEDGVRYHGRDLAVVRATQAGAVAVLGSATPSLESYRNVEVGRWKRLLLPTRANPTAAARPLPPIEVLDLRQHLLGPDRLLSAPLIQAMHDTLAAGEQTILFLNRRGFSPLVLCRACGEVLRCRDCAVSLTYHRRTDQLVCHYCGRHEALPRLCPKCHQPALDRLGAGTERAETVVKERFPQARVERLDRDTTGSAQALERMLARVQTRDVDILVGTQMVTKGHDFAGVTLVGVLLPDQGMHLPDFRATERTFQLLEQVAGRAGRAERAGRVLVQTYNPDHPAIIALRTHDYEGFVKGELQQRQHALYPPFTRMVALRVDGPDAALVQRVATELAQRARSAGGPAVRCLGPAEAPIVLLRGRTRWQVWLSSHDRVPLVRAARSVVGVRLPQGVRVAIDVDPQSVL